MVTLYRSCLLPQFITTLPSGVVPMLVAAPIIWTLVLVVIGSAVMSARQKKFSEELAW